MMLCVYCNTHRPSDDAPCPHCGAPSPLLVGPVNGYGAPRPLATIPTNGYGAPAPTVTGSMVSPSAQTASQPQQPSLLPVPYQGVPLQRSLIMAPNSWEGRAALIPAPSQNSAAMVPAPPETEEFIHVSPMYIKPRALIPRYRIVSGLISFLIVSILLCTGAGYYAKVTGKLAFLQQLWGDARPQNQVSRSVVLPDPPAFPDYGPAQGIINSASTASKIDPNTATLLQPSNIFAPGQTIYLTYSVHPKKPGFVTFKWYTNNVLYTTSFTKTISSAQDGFNTMQYTQAVEGKVELYWNNQLAITLFFVVR